MVEKASKKKGAAKVPAMGMQQHPLDSMLAEFNKIGSDFYTKVTTQALSLPMCLHLSRETLKAFLLAEVDKEEVERA